MLNVKTISINEFNIVPKELASLLNLLSEQKITSTVAKEIFNDMVTTNKTAIEIVNKKGLFLSDDDSLLIKSIEQVLIENSDIAAKYRAGKISVMSFLIGAVLKKTQGKLSPHKIKDKLFEKLK